MPPEIRRATAEEIVDLRHAVLRAGLQRETAVFAGDDDPATRHFAAVDEAGRVIGCATLRLNAHDGEGAWQLRGMAVAPDERDRSVGSMLLAAADQSVKDESPT